MNQVRRQKTPFPKPVSGLSEKSLIWRWFEVVQWLYKQKLIEDKSILDAAKFIKHINVVLDERDTYIKTYRDYIFSWLTAHPKSTTPYCKASRDNIA